MTETIAAGEAAAIAAIPGIRDRVMGVAVDRHRRVDRSPPSPEFATG
jgi:hypothetical protein